MKIACRYQLRSCHELRTKTKRQKNRTLRKKMKFSTEYINWRIMEDNISSIESFDSSESLWTRWHPTDRRQLYLDVISRKKHVARSRKK